MRTWIFQGNAKVFDLEDYLAASSGLVTWTVVRYADQISPGDTVYIWQSKGQDAAQAGNLAAGTMQSGMGWTRRAATAAIAGDAAWAACNGGPVL